MIYKQVRILFWVLLCGSTLFTSCTKKGDLIVEEEEKKEEISYKTGNDLSVSHTVTWERPWKDEEHLMLGYGYDATGKYAHPSSIRAKVIDLQQMGKSAVRSIGTTSSGSTAMRTGSLDKFVRALGTNANINEEVLATYKNLFRESFADKFVADTTTYSGLEYVYAYVSQHMILRNVYFDPFYFNYKSAEEIDRAITTEFKQDVALKSADDVILKYGTHALQNTILGKRVDYLYRYTPFRSHDAQYWFTQRIRENFNIIPSVFIFPDDDTTNPDKENLYMEVVDNTTNKPNAWMIDVTNYSGKRVEYNGWSGGNIEEESTLIDISFARAMPGLIPIYEFVQDPLKKQEIKMAMEKYLSE